MVDTELAARAGRRLLAIDRGRRTSRYRLEVGVAPDPGDAASADRREDL
jgi:hypothetical protein